MAMLGPAFQDLKDVFHTDMRHLSYGNTIMSVTYGVGGLVGGIAFNYFSRQLILAAAYLLLGVTFGTLTLFGSVIFYYFNRGFMGLFAGLIDVGCEFLN